MSEETKVCSKCHKELPLESFYDWRNGKKRPSCKECFSRQTGEYQAAHPEQRVEYTYRGIKKYRENPENLAKEHCRKKAQYALIKGEIEKQYCEVCGSVKSEMHHDDYTRPLDVRWLCHLHHGQYHRALREREAKNAALA